jgi:fructosamine-3-kinase
MEERLRRALEDVLDVDVIAAVPVHGDVAIADRLDLADGRRAVAKTHADPPPGSFATEASGLSWLRDPGAVRIPEVLAVSDDPPLLVLRWIERGAPRRGTEPGRGRALARLHRAGAPAFGREDRRPTGSRGLPNEPCPTWGPSPLPRTAPTGALRGSGSTG